MNYPLYRYTLISQIIMTIWQAFFQTSQTKWSQVTFSVDNGLSLGKE